MTRREFAGVMTAGVAAPAARPNVVLILADDLGYGDLSAWGAPDIRTPNIDALAASGIRFGNFYSNSPVCSPTRASLMTGCYPDCVGMPGMIRTQKRETWGYLDPKAVLLPRRLKPAGYHTALVGKWNLGLASPSLPNEKGFDHFHGFLGDMMDDYWTHRREGQDYMRLNRETIDPRGHATDLFTNWAVDYLKSRRGGTQPFFLYLAYNAPHIPLQPKPEWLDRVRARTPGLSEKRAKLAALIEHMDQGVGQVMDELKQHRNTLVLFVSDNGGDLKAEASCGSLHGGKGEMFEGGIRVPMCAAWTGKIRAGASSDCVGLTMDLFATICEAAGAVSGAEIDGVSLLGEMRHPAGTSPQRDLVWVRREGWPMYQGRAFYALRRGDWKLLQNTPFERYRLYNLKDDPGETRDLAAAQPKIFQDLTTALMLHIQRAGRVPWQPPGHVPSI